jgi:hypothetical protein
MMLEHVGRNLNTDVIPHHKQLEMYYTEWGKDEKNFLKDPEPDKYAYSHSI